MQDKTFFQLYKGISIILFIHGLPLPEIIRDAPFKKLTWLTHRCLGGILIAILLTFSWDSIANLMQQEVFSFNFFYKRTIHTIASLIHVHRFYLLYFNHTFAEILHSLQALKDEQSKLLKNAQNLCRDEGERTVRMLYILLFANIAPSVFFGIQYSYIHKGPNNIVSFSFMPNTVAIVYTLSASFSITLGTGVYFCTIIFVLSAFSVQLRILRLRLAEIFDHVTHYEGGVQLDWSDGSQDQTLQKISGMQKIRAEKELKVWINHHVTAITFMNKINKFFRLSSLLTIVLSISLMPAYITMAVKGTSDSSTWINVSVSVISYYIAASYGSRVITEAESLAYDALGKSYHLYPKHMQHSLKFILTMSQHKKFVITFFSLYPLSIEQFFAVAKLCYSCISFLSGFGIKKE